MPGSVAPPGFLFTNPDSGLRLYRPSVGSGSADSVPAECSPGLLVRSGQGVSLACGTAARRSAEAGNESGGAPLGGDENGVSFFYLRFIT